MRVLTFPEWVSRCETHFPRLWNLCNNHPPGEDISFVVVFCGAFSLPPKAFADELY